MSAGTAPTARRVLRQLPNGVTVYADPYDAPTAAFALYVDGGTQLESPRDNGVTHLLEHVLFKSRGPDGRSVVDVGRELGAELNAFTWWLGLCAHMRVVRDLAAEAADLVCWQVADAELSPEALEEERQVVRQELMRSRSDPEIQATQVAQGRLFGSGGLGLPILGTAESIAALTPQQVADVYRAGVCGRRLTLVGTGAFDVGMLLDTAARRLGGLPAGTPAPSGGSPLADPPHDLALVPDAGVRNAHLVYCVREASYPSDEYFATVVRAGVLGDETRAPSRLRAALVETGLAVDVAMRYQGYAELGTSFVYVCAPAARVPEVDAAVREVLATPVEPTRAEVEGARARIVTRVLLDSETTSKRAMMLARTLTGRRHGEHVDDLVAGFRAVRSDDVARLPWAPAFTCAGLVPAAGSVPA